MNTEKKIDFLCDMGIYMLSNDEEWIDVIDKAVNANPWFTYHHVKLAIDNIVRCFLQKDKLLHWAGGYQLPANKRSVGIVMAGNIPLVGFHDLLCGFMSGHQLFLKLSSKDEILLTHLVNKLIQWKPSLEGHVNIADQLKGCDAYIATGSNNTARYFEQYFGRYPHIIRKNRTSVAILDGNETLDELRLLADDVFQYFGLGCRNVTQVCIPEGYDLTMLLDAFTGYKDLTMHHKYNNNYDYYLAIYLLNKVPYITNGSVLLVENDIPFSGVSVLHYRYYNAQQALVSELKNSDSIQTIVGKGFTPFGSSQSPALDDYADGIDTMQFLCGL